jgi:hypothetical protein
MPSKRSRMPGKARQSRGGWYGALERAVAWLEATYGLGDGADLGPLSVAMWVFFAGLTAFALLLR